ncbi:MAG: glycosyltransferase family 4 protein [Solobacterium sp.]|nr:glycosyltransferase family 4 protein [Solobacterium sp.]
MIVTNHSYMLYRFRKELLSRLSNYSTIVICTPFVGHEDDFRDCGYTLIETPINRRGMNPAEDAKLIAQYRSILKEQAPDLVITYSIKPNIYMGSLCAMYGVPYIANVQGLGTAFESPKMAAVVSRMYKHGLRKAYKVIFENDGDAQVFVERRIVQRKDIEVMQGAGVNLSEYTYHEFPGNDPVHFLFVGRIMKEKGVGELFDAAERLNQSQNIVLDIIGFYEDEYKARVEDLVEKGIAVFHGFQENPIPYYVASDCVVMPSYHEGMTNVNLEASALGRPVITTDIPGCNNSVDEGITGYLVRPRDTQSLYNAMKHFLTLSIEERASLGRNARIKMENEFDRNGVVSRMSYIVSEVLYGA